MTTMAGRSQLRRAMSLAGWLLFAGLVVVWFVLARPVALGGSTTYLKVSGTSMEPGLHTGDLAVLWAADSYQIGDVVGYHVPRPDPAAGSVIIHRIVDIGLDGFVMHGDNTSAPDPWRPTDDDVMGRMVFSLPGFGFAINAFGNPALLAALMFGFGFVTVMLMGSDKSANAKARSAGSA